MPNPPTVVPPPKRLTRRQVSMLAYVSVRRTAAQAMLRSLDEARSEGREPYAHDVELRRYLVDEYLPWCDRRAEEISERGY